MRMTLISGLLLLLSRRHPLAEAIDTAALEVLLRFTRVDRVAHTADFDGLLLNRAWDHEDRPTGHAGRLCIEMHLWMDSGLHSVGIVQKREGEGKGLEKGF